MEWFSFHLAIAKLQVADFMQVTPRSLLRFELVLFPPLTNWRAGDSKLLQMSFNSNLFWVYLLCSEEMQSLRIMERETGRKAVEGERLDACCFRALVEEFRTMGKP